MEKKIDEKKEITFENVDISISVNAQGKSEFDNVTKKNTKRRKVMTTAVAAISSVALLATATYAWFVLTNRPTVSEMTMQAGTSGNLQISLDSDGDSFGSNVTFTFVANSSTYTPALKPLASKDGLNFYVPTYNSLGVVTGVNETSFNYSTADDNYNKSEADGGMLIQEEFYLRGIAADDTDEIGIRLMGDYDGDGDADDFTRVFDTEDTYTGSKAVRISFVYDDDDDYFEEVETGEDPVVTVYEPNANYSTVTGTGNNRTTIAGQFNPYTEEEGGIGEIVYRYIRQNENGLFQTGYASNTITAASAYSEVYSPELFRIPTNTACKVTMYVWLEGTDPNCTNAVEGQTLKTKLMFFSNDLQ